MMKTKDDFVTNSSSTAYVVLIPENFHINAGDIKISWDCVDEEEQLPVEQIHKEVLDLIDVLKIGEDVWCYGYEYTHPEIYDTIIELCRENNFILTVKDLNGEGNNMIQGIPEKKVTDIILNSTDLNKTFNFLRKEKDDVKKE